MENLFRTLHVLAAVLLVGPLVLAPFLGRRAIARRAGDGVRTAAAQLAVFGAGSLLIVALGVVALLRSDEYDFGTPWVIISITLYVILLAVVFGYGVPALRKAARMVDEGVLPRAQPGDGDDLDARLTATTADLQTKERLDAIAGRVAGAGLLVLAVAAAIVVMMTAKPF